ncbi:secretin N-terminal domain-containing protein [Escherichia coli]|uniref:secretin N-terminal domain-containing protein n=1 Tax=Escherichia coli TaxID=562 RepID=UPI00311B2E2D
MKQWIAALLLMLIPGVQAAKPQKVTLMVDDVPVAQVLQALAEQEKLNLVVSPDVSGTVSLHLTDVPWKQALQTVVKSAGLITRQEGNILSVHSIAWQNDNIARQEAEQARAQANLPLENRSITLQYADAGELAKAGEKLLSAKGSMTVDKRTNRLLLRDNKTALSALEQWVAQMDLPVGQVELSAHIVTINEKSLRELGVKWTLVEVKSGETLALGGIFTRKNKSGQDSVPLLGDIPWFGQLFRHDGKEDERRELVVFITPRLVSSE